MPYEDRAEEIAQRLYQMAQHTETKCAIETIATALRDFAKPIGPFKLQNAQEVECWIAVYAANSDNEGDSSDQLAQWADAAVYELRKRYP